MPKMKIPCPECRSEKEKIEEAGDLEVVSCDAIEGESGWCEIVWRRRGATRASAKPSKRSPIQPQTSKVRSKKQVNKRGKKRRPSPK